MSSLKLFAAAILASVVATPALAQAVIDEPGYCAQFYPTANCNNEGPGNPLTDPNWRRDLGAGAQSKRRMRPLALCGSDDPGIGRNPEAHASIATSLVKAKALRTTNGSRINRERRYQA